MCIYYFIIYSLVILFLYSKIQYTIDIRMMTAFPSMGNFLEYDYELIKENYSAIPKKEFPNCSYIVFDETGKVVYASNLVIKDKITADDLLILSDYENNNFYSVYKNYDADGNVFYRITYNEYNSETGLTTFIGDCIVDSKLNVIDGILFDKKNKLTEKEFLYIQGLYNEENSISKYSYTTNENELRTVVFTAPKYSEKSYNKLIKSNRILWFTLVPVIIIATLLFSVILSVKIRKNTRSINKMLRSYRGMTNFEINKNDVLFEFRETVETLDILLNKLDDANNERKRILADISHDLKTPLTVIDGYAKAFENGLIPEGEEKKYISLIATKIHTAHSLFEKLCDYTRMEHPDYKACFEKTDICEFTKMFFAERYNEIETSHFELSVSIPEDKIYVLLDKQLFTRCLENLLNNAIRYNSAGTTIFVIVKKFNDRVCISLCDNGVGIRKEIAESIFEPFVTGNIARTSGESTGLGLSIVKKIIETHNGTICLKTKPETNYSTEFVIQLNIL